MLDRISYLFSLAERTCYVMRIPYSLRDDAIQEFIISVMNSSHSDEAILIKIGRDKIIDFLRKINDRMIRNIDFESIPSKNTEKRDYSEIIDSLPDQQSNIIKMIYFEGNSQKDCSERLSISQQKVSRMKNKALSSIRKKISV